MRAPHYSDSQTNRWPELYNHTLPLTLTLTLSEWSTAELSDTYDKQTSDYLSFNPFTTVIDIQLTLLKEEIPSEGNLSFYVIASMYHDGGYMADADIFYSTSGGKIGETPYTQPSHSNLITQQLHSTLMSSYHTAITK